MSVSPGSPTPGPTESPGTGEPSPRTGAPTARPTPVTSTIRGEAVKGVEPGCMVLTAPGGKTYLLIGGDRSLIERGGRLEVVGREEPDLVTTCMQGIPFVVAEARSIS